MISDSRRSQSYPLELSAVIVTRNEADRVRDCIESVIAACERAVSEFEIILVDSASTDRTVERALEYPITVLRIPDEQVVSAGAGRYVGDQAALGELVLHVDGDMILTETWLSHAVEYLRDNGEVTGVDGALDSTDRQSVTDVEYTRGVMLFDREALQSAGGFNPHLLGYEDVEVGYRLSMASHRLVRLPSVAAFHQDADGPLSESLRRWREGYYAAAGQVIRHSLWSPELLGKLLARQRYKATLLVWLCLGIAALLSTPLALGWLLGSGLGTSALVALRGSGEAVRFLLTKAFGLAGLVVGLGKPTPAPHEFPLETVEVLRGRRVYDEQVRSSREVRR